MKKIMTMVIMAVSFSVGATGIRQTSLFNRWLTDTSTFFDAEELDRHQSQVIFYREATAINGPAVNIYVDGNYHTSLLPEHYKAVVLCAQTHFFSTAFSRATNFADKSQGVYFTVPSKQSSFIKVVSGSNGEPEFERVDAVTGKSAVQRMPPQKQTLSRVASAGECREKIVLQNFALSAKALFQNGRADLNGMLEAGKKEMHDLASDLKRLDPRRISHIVISGHSAPGESVATSMKLSAERAKTVLNFLQREGVQFPMEVTGYSSQQSLSQSCAAGNSNDINSNNIKMKEACDQSNRRVEVTVYAIQ
ncbi:hypothetical protein OA57_11375 [Chelonobacter oris]|uniref:OmpA-like domain-containing protein n=1 Tax=Chelonobacter oris TaxID=505317 RepID=A0A0A3AJD5_9PAST|nr:OmpA family protein [Chelonobacter oris]KGQ69518.1 hypothetical protein OA57_11375 [Chelonobacter oris]